MNNKIKNIVTSFVFVVFIAFFAVLCCTRFVNPVEYSDVEKRPMAQLPTDFTWQELLENETVVDEQGNVIDTPPIKDFEDFAVDQFPFREFFRSIKSNFALRVLGLKENNGYAMEDGSIAEIKPSFTEPVVDMQIGKLEYLYNIYLANNGGNHYLAIVPDKNYYFAQEHGYISPDYEWLVDKMQTALPGMTYIDLFDSLELEDYYKTDWHWNQSKLDDGVLLTLGNAMGFADRLSGDYTENVLDGFYGGYYDQSALYPSPEKLTYLTNDVLDACTVYDYLTKIPGGTMYNPEFFHHPEQYEGKVQYDFFLAGTKPLLRIDNPNATTDKELIIFRDSFGSSLIPLMAEGYKRIYVADIRYINPDGVLRERNEDGTTKGYLPTYENLDVLFIFSATVLNSNNFQTPESWGK